MRYTLFDKQIKSSNETAIKKQIASNFHKKVVLPFIHEGKKIGQYKKERKGKNNV